MTSKEKKEEIITPKGDKVYVTKEGLKRLEDELEYLRNVKRPQIAEKLENAVQAFGELTENAEYEETKREQALIEGRISELEELLSKAIIIDTDKISKVAVGIGSKVKILVKNLKDKSEETMEFMLVSSVEGEPDENKISIDSPIGEAIIGKRKGDVVKVKIPKGEVLIKIISIEK
ncbi:MAG: transcription elongation factor GreA [Caldisericia bacterium]|nr:transcription elongation factor GreA [Caldisericia bacterium]